MHMRTALCRVTPSCMQSWACAPWAACVHGVAPVLASPLSDAPAFKQDRQSPANTRRSTCDQRPTSGTGLPGARRQRRRPARRAAPACNASQNTLECQSRLCVPACLLTVNRRRRPSPQNSPGRTRPASRSLWARPPLRRAADRRRSTAAGAQSAGARCAQSARPISSTIWATVPARRACGCLRGWTGHAPATSGAPAQHPCPHACRPHAQEERSAAHNPQPAPRA